MAPPEREAPIVLEPTSAAASASDSGALIFLHGLSDDAAGVCNIGEQLHGAGRLKHVRFVFPNALENRDMMSTAWYVIGQLSPAPPSRPELAEDEDEEGLGASVRYIESLIDEQVQRGVPPHRIVVGGFSQGMAVSLLLGITSSKYAGKLGGLLLLCGYLPLEDKVKAMREETGVAARGPGPTQVCLIRGKADMLVPSRYSILARDRLVEMGYAEGEGGALKFLEYEGVGHSINGRMIGDMCAWLEMVLPLAG